ncbi:MAG: NADPH-dependent F420 reductase [Anaerolineae bacterium]|nr:NADPH-dependent F420 reductase [Anaerolineae bacterium]MDW8071157.1 NADPH-dependent F420 reductase [Anaerolineae bacterium]
MAEKTVAIIGGTGHQGPGLALRWAKSGRYRVIIGSRDAAKAQSVAASLNMRLGDHRIEGMPNAEAAAAAEIVVLTVPYSAHTEVLESIREQLTGKVLVDVTVPLRPPRVSHVYIPPAGSATAEAQALLGTTVRVVCAFQNVSATHLSNLDEVPECDILVCGDDPDAKAEAIALAEAAGMRGLDAGPLQNAGVVEGLTAILIGINKRYRAEGAGIKITGLP